MTEKSKAILAIDQGTTSSRAIIFDHNAQVVAAAQQEFPQLFPANGWVEHDPEAIWASTLSVCREAIAKANAKNFDVVAIGVTNQRETTILWDRETGKPLYNAIVWQDRRTADRCEEMKADKLEETISDKTGLLLDPYFSASKVGWILNSVDGVKLRAQAGKVAFGTVDSFLLWRLTGGKKHATDATNASRTGLYNIKTNRWDEDLLKLYDVPESILPEVLDCNAAFGQSDPDLFGKSIPILGIAGDQQAASIGQACFAEGDTKSTYGTGCFVLVNTGTTPLASKNRLLSTIAWRVDGKTTYALEGSIFVAGAGVQWLRDQLHLINAASDTEGLARGLSSNDGVYIVPAFTGLGAPHWQSEIRGAIFGLTRATGPAELARAMVESVCYQTHDLLQAVAEDGVAPKSIRVDGGMVANNWMCEYLAGVLNLTVERPRIMETTALGAAYLAGMTVGLFGSFDEIAQNWAIDRKFSSKLLDDTRNSVLADWKRAVAAAKSF